MKGSELLQYFVKMRAVSSHDQEAQTCGVQYFPRPHCFLFEKSQDDNMENDPVQTVLRCYIR